MTTQNIIIIVLAIAFILAVVLLLISMRSKEKLLRQALEMKQDNQPAQNQPQGPEFSSPALTHQAYTPIPTAIESDHKQSLSVRSSVLMHEGDPAEPSPVSDLKDAIILLVEDDAELREYVADELSMYVKEVVQAVDGIDASNALNDGDISIIVSDVMMPRMDGFELCRYVKTTVAISHIPVILLTARSDSESRMLGYKNGADDYITKPFDFTDLIEAIKRLFYGRDLARRRVVEDSNVDVSEVTFSSADEKFMKKFDEFVNANIMSPDLDTKMLVEYMGMSRTVLFNKVKQLTGLNLQGYTNKVRMDHVKTLLTTTDLPISEVARMCGFSSSRYLSTSFKNYTGFTPSEYKRANQI